MKVIFVPLDSETCVGIIDHGSLSKYFVRAPSFSL